MALINALVGVSSPWPPLRIHRLEIRGFYSWGRAAVPCCLGRHRDSAFPLPSPIAGLGALFVLSSQAACCPRAATRPSTLSCPSGTIPLGSAVHDILQPHPVVRYDLISVIRSPSGEFVWMIADLLVRYSSRAGAGLLSHPPRSALTTNLPHSQAEVPPSLPRKTPRFPTGLLPTRDPHSVVFD